MSGLHKWQLAGASYAGYTWYRCTVCGNTCVTKYIPQPDKILVKYIGDTPFEFGCDEIYLESILKS